MKSILDPSFRYTASFNTDLQKTFARIRRETCATRKRQCRQPPARSSTFHRSRERKMRNGLIRAVDAALLGHLGHGSGEHRYRASRRQHRDQPAGVSAARRACPGYPVYYAPQVNSNYFFYDGMYWVYQRDNWYASSWYNGPWGLVAPEAVPLYVLRVPVRYYRQPPAYFRGWRADAPPRWGEHWGNAWEQSHSGWDNWNRSAAPAPAPLPVYQRQYSGNRYPRVEQQQVLQTPELPLPAARRRSAAALSGAAGRSGPRVRSAGTAGSAATEDPPPPYQQGVSRPTALPHSLPPPPHGRPPQQAGANVQRPAVAEAGSPAGRSECPASEAAATARCRARRSSRHQRGRASDRGPQGQGAPHESKQGQQNGPDNGEPQGGNRNK